MLHSASLTTFVPSERLAETAICPNCSAKVALSGGVIHLGHYDYDGEVREGLIWTCSDRCFLSGNTPASWANVDGRRVVSAVMAGGGQRREGKMFAKVLAGCGPEK